MGPTTDDLVSLPLDLLKSENGFMRRCHSFFLIPPHEVTV